VDGFEAARCECVVESCSAKIEATAEELLNLGWRGLCISEKAPVKRDWRTHLGWCPKCVTRFSVE